jgi:uncharacterized protein YlxW (UPF0749 family)
MQLTVNSNTIGIAVAFCMQLGALFWWASHIQTQQENIIEELSKTERLQNQLTSQQETIFELRYKIQILESK